MADEFDDELQRPRRSGTGIDRLTTGVLGLPVAAAREGLGNMGTDIANLGRRAIGGQTQPRPGYPRTAQLASQVQQGAADFARSNQSLLTNVQTGLRNATGTLPAVPQQQAQPSPGVAALTNLNPQGIQGMARTAAAPARPATPLIGDLGSTGASRPVQAGNGIAMSITDGIPGFTNDRATVAGASPMPAGGVGTVGNGAGTFSQLNPGDSRLAIDRFERANQERARMIEESRRGQLGEGGGRLTIVRDSTRAPSRADIQNARLDAMQAQTNLQNQQGTQAMLAGIDERQTSAVQRQRMQQDITSGAMEMQASVQLQRLRDQIADPSLSDSDRAAARQAYNVLATQAKDRYLPQDVVLGQGNNGPVIGRQIIDLTTGLPVAGGTQAGGSLPMGVTREAAIAEAKAAVAAGVDKDAVNQRLAIWGLDPV